MNNSLQGRCREIFQIIKYTLVLMNFALIPGIHAQVLFFDENASGPAITFGLVKSHEANGYEVDWAYVFSGKHAFAFSYGSAEDSDHKWNHKSYGISYIGIMHETMTKPNMLIQGALNIGYIHMPDLTSDAVNIGLTLFKRFKFEHIILLPEIYGGYGVTIGRSPTSYLREGGVSLSLGLMFGPRKEHLLTLGPSVAWSEVWVFALGIGLSINSILH